MQWSFNILDKKGNIIRSFSERGLLPEEIVWDGRDNSGALVEDGKYKYRFEIWTLDGETLQEEGSLVSIDTRGPSGTLGLAPDEQ
jgi:flagellar hook assembly protein FlgD